MYVYGSTGSHSYVPCNYFARTDMHGAVPAILPWACREDSLVDSVYARATPFSLRWSSRAVAASANSGSVVVWTCPAVHGGKVN